MISFKLAYLTSHFTPLRFCGFDVSPPRFVRCKYNFLRQTRKLVYCVKPVAENMQKGFFVFSYIFN